MQANVELVTNDNQSHTVDINDAYFFEKIRDDLAPGTVIILLGIDSTLFK